MNKTFPRQADLDQKTARFEEIMEILNPKSEQVIGESDDVQEQARYRLDEDGKPLYTKRSNYNEAETLFMQWANGSTPVGEVKSFYRFGKAKFYEKTAEGCIELSRAQYNEKVGYDGKNIDRRAERKIGNAADFNESAAGNASGYSDDYGNAGNGTQLSQYSVGEELRHETGGSVPDSGRGFDPEHAESLTVPDDAQYQQRTSPLSDREVLTIAANDLNVEGLNEGEMAALDIFRKRMDTLKRFYCMLHLYAINPPTACYCYKKEKVPKSKDFGTFLVEISGIEPLTS